MKIIKKLTLEEAVEEYPPLMDALCGMGDPNGYYCNTCDGIRMAIHTCYCPFCKQSFPNSDPHKNCPELAKYKPK